jgi:hypothetical protein
MSPQRKLRAFLFLVTGRHPMVEDWLEMVAGRASEIDPVLPMYRNRH